MPTRSITRIDGVLRERRANTQSDAALTYWLNEAGRVLSHLQERHDAYVTAGRDTLDVAWAIQNARIVQQAAGSLRTSASRDSNMAINVEWIAAHQPAGTKFMLWAHNGHVARQPAYTMGSHLTTRYGNAMRVVGFSLGDGDFTAVGPRGLAAYPAAPPEASTLEEAFRATNIPRFALDLRTAANTPGSAFLAAPHDFRSIGAQAMDRQFFPTSLASQFDVVIYFDHTTPSTRLAFPTRP